MAGVDVLGSADEDDDDLPPLVDQHGYTMPHVDATMEAVDHSQQTRGRVQLQQGLVENLDAAIRPEAHEGERFEEPQSHKGFAEELLDGIEAQADKATIALQTAVALQAAHATADVASKGVESLPTALDAIRGAMAETAEEKHPAKAIDDTTKRMITAITKDDFEECEDAILQGADIAADCGGGMCALHLAAIRGDALLTELLLAHGAKVNQRDLSGNTPLLYTCHFYRHHNRGVQMVSQLLYHKADPHYRVKEGKLAGQSALDIMEKACIEPNMDEDAPRQMRAMVQLSMDGSENGFEAITQVWMQHKSKNKKLYEMSSKKDTYDYKLRNIEWVTPKDAKNAASCTPPRLTDTTEAIILEETFTHLQDYLFADEGGNVKVYVNFPEVAYSALADANALAVTFELQSFDVRLRTAFDNYRLKIDPLYGSIEVGQCKHRVSTGSGKVTLTLAKRHKNRLWPALQKTR
mmetsp:Transcript_115115/g.229263  ORF Transcript_115115/g.229263 Transcript_115115/m.229263 type:complete len:466 (+) Transcript_115115:34-1431(+)